MMTVLENNPCYGPGGPGVLVSVVGKAADINDWYVGATFAAISPYLKPGAIVLDLGCGPGSKFPKAILREGCDYVGVDQDEGCLIRKAYSLHEHSEHVMLVNDDVLSLLACTPSDFCDVVLADSVITHLNPEKQSHVIREMHRVAKHAVFVSEGSLNKFGNNERPELFDLYRRIDKILMEEQGSEHAFAEKLPSFLTKNFPRTPMEIFRVNRPMGNYCDEFFPQVFMMFNYLSQWYEGLDRNDLINSLIDMCEYIEEGEVSFVPSSSVIAHIPKNPGLRQYRRNN